MPDLAGVNELVYTSPNIGSNNYLLQQGSGDLNLYDNGALVASDPISQVTAVNIGGQTDNALTIDYTGMTTNIAVTFDGGSGDGSLLAHTLTLENGSFTNETYTYSGTGSGGISLDGQSVTYSDLTSSSNTTTVTNLALDLPSSSQRHAAGWQPQGCRRRLGFATSGFENPSNSLTVNSGGGNSVIQLGNMDAGFLPPNETFSGVTGDIFRLTSAAALPPPTSLTVSTVTLDLHGFSPTINVLSGNGTITDSTVSTPTLTVGNSNGSGGFSGIIKNGSGTVAITKIGTGTETFSGLNTYSGQTTINSGALADGANNSLPSAHNIGRGRHGHHSIWPASISKWRA